MIKMPRRAITAIALASTALVPLTTAAFAQQGDSIVLEEVLVEADAIDGTGVAVETSTGSKVPVAITEVPQSVSVVTRAQLDKLPGAKADETLRYSAGVNPSTYGTDADYDWIFIRGFQANQTGVFLDGLNLYQYGFGSYLIDPFLLDRVEVLKGPSSALYGGANVGGVLNYVGKRPTGERLRYTETGINNHGNAYVGVDIGDATAAGDLAYRFTGKVSGGGWETDDAEDLRGNFLGSVTWTPDDATSLTLYAHYNNTELTHTSTGFLPFFGTAVDGPGGIRIPRDFNYGDPDFDSYERQQAMVGYEFKHELDSNWTVRSNGRFSGVQLDEQYIYPDGYDTTTLADDLRRVAFQHDTTLRSFTMDNQLAGEIVTGPLEHSLLFGLDYKNVDISDHQGSDGWWTGRVPPIDIFNPVYGGVDPIINYYQDDDINLQQLGLYAQDQIRYGNWIATLNGRYDFVNIDYENGTTPVRSTTSEEGAFTGRVGLGYEFENGLTPYLSYGTSFNPSIASELGGGLLESERGQQWEAGVKYEPTFLDGLITASVFSIDRENFSVSDPDNFGYSLPIGEVNVTGFEVEGLVNFDNVTLLGALTFLDAEVTASLNPALVGNTPVQIPTLTASLGVEYHFDDQFEGLTVGAGMRYLGESAADNENTAEVPAATLFDASLRYEKDDWGLSLNVSNIFDESYVSSCQGLNSCGYGAGRQVTLSLHKNW